MKAIRKEVEDACEQKEILDPEIESLRSEFSRHHSSLDEKLGELQELRRKTERAEQIMKDLPVNNEDIESMKRKSATNIRKALATARQSLSNLGKVNIQAINSYFEIQKFTSKADQELEQYRTCVEEIAVFHDYLRERRKNALDGYFHIFSEEFTRIFRKLAGPGTQGRLYKLDEEQSSESERITSGIRTAIDFGCGVRKNEQLSGGQKTVVALSQILALQHFETAPFFLFDEVDAALDIVYKKRLAEYLSGTRKRQVILTSHAPEMLKAGDNLFYVSTDKHRKCPLLKQLTEKEAEVLVQQAILTQASMTQDESQTQVTQPLGFSQETLFDPSEIAINQSPSPARRRGNPSQSQPSQL